MHHFYSETSEIRNGIFIIPMSMEDAESYRKLRNRNRECFFHTETISAEKQREWYLNYLKKQDELMFSILNGSCTFIGGCGIYNIDRNSRTAEFGRIIIDESQRGEGYSTIVAKCVCHIAKNALGLISLYLEVRKDNISAVSAYKRSGFKYIRDKETGNSMIMEIGL